MGDIMKNINKAYGIIYLFLMGFTLILLLFFDNINYNTKVNFIFPNIYIFISSIFILILFIFYPLKFSIDKKKYYLWLLIIFVVCYVIELVIQKYCFFRTGWDVDVIIKNSDYFISTGKILNVDYFTRYPNNLFLLFIFILIKKTIPLGLAGILIINSFLVSLSCLFTSLTIKNILNDYKVALMSYLVMIPLILFNPWIIITYSDTFAILFPILIIYLYTQKNKKPYIYFLLIFLSIIGCFIKPTVIIVLISIIIIEVTNSLVSIKKIDIKKFSINFCAVILSILISFSIKYFSRNYLSFNKSNVYEFNFTHFLAMGQNDITNGVYSTDDVLYSIKNGMTDNLKIFRFRISNRSFVENVKFFSKKNLINYNNGTFSWGIEGNFYNKVGKSNSKLTNLLRNYYFKEGKYYKYFIQISQFVWIFLLCFTPFIYKNKNSKIELVIMLSITGITLFLLLFEARTRYLYCYSPVFVLCGILGFNNIKTYIRKRWRIK